MKCSTFAAIVIPIFILASLIAAITNHYVFAMLYILASLLVEVKSNGP